MEQWAGLDAGLLGDGWRICLVTSSLFDSDFQPHKDRGVFSRSVQFGPAGSCSDLLWNLEKSSEKLQLVY